MTDTAAEAGAVDEVQPMDGSGRPTLLDRYAPYFAAVALAIPTLLTYYPPMTDLPMHEGVVGVMRHFGDPRYFPKDIYELNIGHPNQLFHIASFLLSFLFDTRWAVKIVIALSQVAIFDAGVRLADHLGRSRWGAILLAPLALGFTYYWGLVANLIGFSAFLYALPVLDNMVARTSWRSITGASTMMILLFFAHESSFMIATGVVVLFTIALPFDRRSTPMRLVPAAFAIVLGLGHLRWQNSRFSASYNINIPPTWFTLWEKTILAANVLFGAHEWMGQALLMALGLTGAGVLLVARYRGDVVDPSTARGVSRARELLYRFRFEVLVVVYLGLYFGMPFNWNGVTMLHERFLGPAWAVLVICVAPRGETPKLAKLAGAVMPLGILLTGWPQFADATRAFKLLDQLLEHIPMGKSTAVCVLEHNVKPFSRIYSAAPGPARVLTTRGGRSSIALTASPISPIRLRRPYRWDEYELRTFIYGSKSLMPTHDLQRWEYVVSQSRDPSTRAKMIRAFAPDADLVFAQGEWLLFHSKKPSLGIDAADGWPPAEAQHDTVMHRLIALDREEARARLGAPAASSSSASGSSPAPTASDGGAD
jgi:hypothetical protein